MSAFHVRVARGKVVQVESVVAAGRAVRAEIESLGWIGSAEWTRTVAGRAGGVIVYDAQQKPVAEVSYNGRVWLRDGSEVVAP